MKKLSGNKKIGIILSCLIAMIVLGLCAFFEVSTYVKKVANAKDTNLNASVTTVPDGYIGIYNAEDLANVENNLSANYILMADIDMTEKEYDIIGAATAFTGTFDGNYHTISNLTIDSTNEYIGLFGQMNNATVINLILDNISVTETRNSAYESKVAGLVGKMTNSNIDNVKINNIILTEKGTITGPIYLGGLVGYQSGGTIRNSSVDGRIETIEKGARGYIGGLTAYIDGIATIEGNNSKINIINNLTGGNIYTGGLIGALSGGNQTEGSIISKNYSEANIESFYGKSSQRT